MEKIPQEPWTIGAFCSVDEGLGLSLDQVGELQIPSIHLHAPSRALLTRRYAEELSQRLQDLEIEVTVLFAGFDGESYADIPTVQRTVGLVPKQTRSERVSELKQIIEFASMLAIEATGMHVGFVPHDSRDEDFAAIVDATRDVCDYAREHDVNLHLETGQEPVGVLLDFLATVDRDNLFVNFDPANMILYGCGAPLETVQKIGPHIRSVHCKDARWSDQPGKSWGEETPLGHGDVDFGAFLAALAKIGYQGPLTIEREIPHDPTRQLAEIRNAIDLLDRLKGEVKQAPAREDSLP